MNEQMKQRVLSELESMEQFYFADHSFGFGDSVSYNDYIEDSFKRISERTGVSVNDVRNTWIANVTELM